MYCVIHIKINKNKNFLVLSDMITKKTNQNKKKIKKTKNLGKFPDIPKRYHKWLHFSIKKIKLSILFKNKP